MKNKNCKSVKKLTAFQKEAVEDALSNNENSSDDELIDLFVNEFDLTKDQATFWLEKRNHYLTLQDFPLNSRLRKEARENNLVKIDKKLKKLQDLIFEVQTRRTINIEAYDDELPKTWKNLLLAINKLEKKIKALVELVDQKNK